MDIFDKLLRNYFLAGADGEETNGIPEIKQEEQIESKKEVLKRNAETENFTSASQPESEAVQQGQMAFDESCSTPHPSVMRADMVRCFISLTFFSLFLAS